MASMSDLGKAPDKKSSTRIEKLKKRSRAKEFMDKVKGDKKEY